MQLSTGQVSEGRIRLRASTNDLFLDNEGMYAPLTIANTLVNGKSYSLAIGVPNSTRCLVLIQAPSCFRALPFPWYHSSDIKATINLMSPAILFFLSLIAVEKGGGKISEKVHPHAFVCRSLTPLRPQLSRPSKRKERERTKKSTKLPSPLNSHFKLLDPIKLRANERSCLKVYE